MMEKFSKDILDYIAAENAIKAIEDAKELQVFIKGEQRESLLDIAAYRLNVLRGQPKQGEQSGPITQEVRDFKGPAIEGGKFSGPVTGSDIVAEIDKADEKRQNAEERRLAEEQAAIDKAKDAAAGPRNYVTAEDVIKRMRAEGKKI